MKVKNQKQVLKLFSALVIIISIERNEQNRRFKEAEKWSFKSKICKPKNQLFCD